MPRVNPSSTVSGQATKSSFLGWPAAGEDGCDGAYSNSVAIAFFSTASDCGTTAEAVGS